MHWSHEEIETLSSEFLSGLLLDNALCSMKRALRSYRARNEDVREYKYAVLHSAQSVELLLKAILAVKGSSMIFRNRKDLAKGTVGLKETLQRLERECGFTLTEMERAQLVLVKDIRNSFEHFFYPVEPEELSRILDPIICVWSALLIGRLLPTLLPDDPQPHRLHDFMGYSDATLIRKIDADHRKVIRAVTTEIDRYIAAKPSEVAAGVRVEVCMNCFERALVVEASGHFRRCFWCGASQCS